MARSSPLSASAGLIQANCAIADAVGDCVYVTGDRVGTLYQVSRIDPRNMAQIPSIGVIEYKLTTTYCLIRVAGLLAQGVYTGLTTQKQTWVAPNGRLTTDRSSLVPLVGGKYAVQQMGIVVAADTVLIAPQSPIIDVY